MLSQSIFLLVLITIQVVYSDSDKKTKEVVPEDPIVENGLYILNEKNFNKHISKGDHFIKFYAPWCGHCKKLAPVWSELAENFKDDKKVKIGKLDCTQAQSVCQDKVQGYPTLLYFRNGEIFDTYYLDRDLDTLIDFVKSRTDGTPGPGPPSKKTGKSPPPPPKEMPPPPEGKSNALILDKTNFDQELKKNGVVFVKFYSPTCGHCRKLAPTWEELATKYLDVKGVKIAKVNCKAANDFNEKLCKDQGVNYFDTYNYLCTCLHLSHRNDSSVRVVLWLQDFNH